MTTPLRHFTSHASTYQIFHPIPTSHFRAALLQFASKNISQEDYLTNCQALVSQLLKSPDYSFYKAGIKQAAPLLDLFKETTAESTFISNNEADSINDQFQTLFYNTLSEKLATDAGQAFYPIPQLSQRDEKIQSFQEWTALFFDHLSVLSDDNSTLNEQLVEKLSRMTMDQLQDYAHSIHLQSFKKMTALMEADPISFQATLKRIHEKAQKDPDSLSLLEKEYVYFIEMYNNYAMNQFPDIEKKLNLMHQCITLGYDLHKKEIPILKPRHLFAETLIE